MPDIRYAYNGKFVSPSSAKIIGDRALPPIAQKTLRFKFYDKTIDPTQWADVWNIGATWTRIKQGIYDWHCDRTEWAGKFSGSGASSGSNSALATYRWYKNGGWFNYLTNVDLDIIDSDLTGVTNVYQLFFVANGVHHCSLKNTGSVQNWGGCFNNSNRNVKLESLDPLDMSSVDVSKFSTPMFNGALYINSPIVLNMPNATSLRSLFAGNNTSSSTLTLNLSSAFTGATASVFGNTAFEEVIITGTTGMTSARYFNSNQVKKYTWTDWNTSGVDCTSMFASCKRLTGGISLPANAKVTNASAMFSDCTVTTTIPSLDLSRCTNTNRMFYGCTALTSAPSYNLSAVTDSSEMFRGCSSLTSAPSLTFQSLTTSYGMFFGCSALSSVPAYDLAGCTNTYNMFNGCTSLTSVPSYVLTSATNTSNMFKGCTSLTSVPSVTLPAATNTSSMFSGCTAVASGVLTMYNYLSTKTVAVTTYNDTFTNCGSNTTTGAAELAQIPTSWGGTMSA